jgi:CBS domain-containing protein
MRSKGSAVVTVSPHETVGTLLDLLAQHNIGAVVVSGDGHQVTGIVSERDVVRRIQSHGTATLTSPVAEIMTTNVYTCQPDDDLAETAGSMTEHRIRHLPVLVDGQLVGIVSIGDIVKNRIDQLQAERDHLEGYINQ